MDRHNLYFQRYFGGVKGKILDVGCGVGEFLAVNPTRIVGVDVDEEVLAFCKRHGFNAVYGDAYDLPFPNNSFEAVHAKSILEHLYEPSHALREMRRVLKPEGRLVLSVPNIEKVKFKFWDTVDHKTPFTYTSMRRLLFDAGFKEYQMGGGAKHVRGLGWAHRSGLITTKQALWFQTMFLMPYGNNIMVVAWKRPDPKRWEDEP